MEINKNINKRKKNAKKREEIKKKYGYCERRTKKRKIERRRK